MAIWLVVLLFESSLVELLQTKCAHKVLWVEFTMHGGDASAGNGLLTAITQSTPPSMVVHFTVGSAIMLKETPTRECLVTFLESKVFQMSVKQEVPV